MLAGYNPIFQAFLGTLLTWGLTALGSALVFIFSSSKRKVLDGSLGFAAGVMTAASYWSLLAPAIELAEQSGSYGSQGEYAFIPAVIGFVLGAVFIYCADIMMPFHSPAVQLGTFAHESEAKLMKDEDDFGGNLRSNHTESSVVGFLDVDMGAGDSKNSVLQRRKPLTERWDQDKISYSDDQPNIHDNKTKGNSWKRIILLIVAITVHNIPEGLAVGVGFGAIGKSKLASFERARNLAIGIGIQNFPEGLAVSLPLRGAGFSKWKSFWYGQLSGMVEPIAGVFGALLVNFAEPILPYSLAFAAGAMIYVVMDDIIPEANSCGNGRLATWGSIIGFAVMMALDVGLG